MTECSTRGKTALVNHELADAQHLLDARALSCPLPLLKMKLALKSLNAGERLEVLVSDKSAEKDFVRFCQLAGHRLHVGRHEEGHLVFIIEKAGD